MDIFAKELMNMGRVPFWMDERTLHCLYLTSKFSNYVTIYNQCFHVGMDAELEELIAATKDMLFYDDPPHSTRFWIPSFCALFPPIVQQCLDVIAVGPDSAWLPGTCTDKSQLDEGISVRKLMGQECERNITPRFLAFCNQSWYGPTESEDEGKGGIGERGLGKTDLADASSLEDIDALATSLKGEDEIKKVKETLANFHRGTRVLNLRLDLFMWLLLYWILHMTDEDYDDFMNFVCGGLPILTDNQVREMESYRKQHVKDTGLEGKMDSAVLSFLLVFYKV